MSCIYIIKHKDSDALYVGSTTDFHLRKINHKSDSYNEKYKGYNIKLYQFILDNGGWKRFDIWKIDCCDEENAFEKEQEYMDKLKPTLNDRRANGFDFDRQKEYHKQYNEKYYENNKDKLNEKMDCDCGGKYTKQHKKRHLKSQKHIDFINSSP